jgi:hypothetical protein
MIYFFCDISCFSSYVTEAFFRQVAEAARNPASTLHGYLESKASEPGHGPVIKLLLKDNAPVKMKHIDMLMANSSIRSEIHQEMGITDSELTYPRPVIDREKHLYIYGFLSFAAHYPSRYCNTLWLRENEHPDFKKYASFLAARVFISVDTFSENEAAAGQELMP